jgi:hypothetical protein
MSTVATTESPKEKLMMKAVTVSRLLNEIIAEAGSSQAMQIVLQCFGSKSNSMNPIDMRTLEAMSLMTEQELAKLLEPLPFEIDPRHSISVSKAAKLSAREVAKTQSGR